MKISNKRGQMPIRTAGNKKRPSFVWIIVGVILIVFAIMMAQGVYNKWIRPSLDSAGITSSLERDGKTSVTIEGSPTVSPMFLDRPDAATFDFTLLDNANENAVISAAVGVGALSQLTDEMGEVVGRQEWLNPSTSNTTSTITNVPEDTVLSFYGGDSTYYIYPLINRKILIGDNVVLDGATIQTETSMAITVYDDTGSVALSAATNASHDYKITVGSGQAKFVFIKVSNNGENKRYDLKAICTAAAGTNVSSFEIVDSDWSKAFIPDFVDLTPTVVLDNLTATTTEYDDCYVYKKGTNEVISLDEWDDSPLIKARIEAKTGKNPFNDVVLFTALDGAWARGSDGMGHFDFYQHDAAESGVGLNESVHSPAGKELGAIIELD